MRSRVMQVLPGAGLFQFFPATAGMPATVGHGRVQRHVPAFQWQAVDLLAGVRQAEQDRFLPVAVA
ncbi:hypothetical protein D3C86_1562390 [compost metagenome]